MARRRKVRNNKARRSALCTAAHTIPTLITLAVGVCAICRDNLQVPTTLQCGHMYCRDCITEWIGSYDTSCPECRSQVTSMKDSDGVEVPLPTATQQHCENSSSTDDVVKPRKTAVAESVSTNAAKIPEFVSKLSETEKQELVRELSRRCLGRAALLNTPTVVRALTASKRAGHRSAKNKQHDKQFKVSPPHPHNLL